MARTFTLLLVALFVSTGPATAQSRGYLSANVSTEGGSRPLVPSRAIPTAAGLVGLRLTDTWALELEVDRSWRTTASSSESVVLSFPPGSNATREEIELYGIRARSDRTQRAGMGWSAMAAWRTRAPGRVNLQLMFGVSSRTYYTTLERRTTFVSPLLNLPPGFRYPDENSARRLVAGGPTGGLAVLVRVTDHVTLAPELRLETGVITDDPYRVFRAGVRTMWLF